MKRYWKVTKSFLAVLFSMALTFSLVSCGGGGGGGTTGAVASCSDGILNQDETGIDIGGVCVTTPKTTTISGKVTLSSTVTGKPAMMKAMYGTPKGKPGSKAYAASKQPSTALRSALFAPVLNATAFANGYVYLYNSDHPEWLCPVSSDQTDSSGNYVMTKLENASCNSSAYTDGADIPAGNYTLLAFKAGGFDPILGITTDALVAVQTVVNKFEGTVSIPDLVAQESTALPTVSAMFGVKQNTDGTQTWGSSSTNMPANAAIQVSFSAAMSRGTLTNGITISPSVSGKWSLSADWTTATFYPDAGVTLAASTVYTVTVKGSDTGATAAVKNVYGNALAKTATGTFTTTAADTVAPTAIFVSPTTAQLAAPVDVTVPIRIGSNKQLDVNGLTLVGNVAGVSSLGAKPGVLYVGKDAASSLYVYEFVLGSPLQLGTTYDLTVSGGKGLNGLAMNSLSGSLQTVSLADVAGGSVDGIGGTTDTTTLNAQAAVKDVFGKWIRAFSDRNLTQMQGLMSGDFYFENDPSKGISEDDLNRDGRYSISEFSNMLAIHAFPQWESCGTTITGDIIGTINVVGNNADFEFKMTATSTNTSQDCGEAAPKDSLYATLQYVNGAWTVVRASEGIDTRDKTISFPDLITVSLSQGGVTISDGGQIQLPYDATGVHTNPATHSWNAVTGVSSYVLVRIDGRDPRHGFACALPTTVTSWATGSGCVAIGGVDVSGKFGFDNNNQPATGAFLVEGGEYYWDVIGLATATVSTIGNKTPLDILKDISAISALQSFTIAGTYKEITVQVYGGNAATGTPATYSVNYDGYDVGSANQATIKVTTADTAATTGELYVKGNFSKNYPFTFTSGVATVIVDLSKGRNWINVWDGIGLNKSFSISTTGGIAPVVEITSITDDKSATPLAKDAWNYYTANTGATKLTITGSVTDTSITKVDVNVWNDASSAYSYTQANVTSGTFTATLEIYKGDNWINVGAEFNDPVSGQVWYGDHAGVYTDTGTVWVPNITITSVTTALLSGDYGNSSDWDASTDTDGIVTITGKFKKIADGTYNLNSDGGWSSDTLKVNSDGSFTLTVELFNGWNYVSINDSNYNWSGVNIYTTTGKAVIKPKIVTINGTAYTPPTHGGSGSFTTSECAVTIVGKAQVGEVHINWNGSDGTAYYYESQNIQATGTAGTEGDFTVTVPVLSGTGSYNNIDIFDMNWKWTGVSVTTSGSCPYVAPVLTVDAVKDSSGTTLTPDMYSNFNAATSTTISVSGTSNQAGRTITSDMWVCGKGMKYTTTSSSTANAGGKYDWTISGIKVYDGGNWININDGYNYPSGFNVNTTNGVKAPESLTVTGVTGATKNTMFAMCGSSDWGSVTATTVTITGTTTAPDGTGSYFDPTGAVGTFTISSGTFTISNVAVYDGYNNIGINDTDMNWYNVSVNTTNGVAKPKFVVITSPAHNTTGVTGIQTVTGIFQGTGYNPTRVNASTFNETTMTTTHYSSDPYDQKTFGDLPITLSAGTFSFDVDFGADPAKFTNINVFAMDETTWINHSHSISVNSTWGQEYWNKPGSKSAAVNPVHRKRLLEMILEDKAHQQRR